MDCLQEQGPGLMHRIVSKSWMELSSKGAQEAPSCSAVQVCVWSSSGSSLVTCPGPQPGLSPLPQPWRGKHILLQECSPKNVSGSGL